MLDGGLRLDFLHEHDQLGWRAFPDMIETGEDLFSLPPGIPRISLAVSLGATKPA